MKKEALVLTLLLFLYGSFSLQARYIVTMNSLRQLQQCFVVSKTPLWITTIKDVLINSQTEKIMEKDTVDSFNKIQKEVVATIAIGSVDEFSDSAISEELKKNNLFIKNNKFKEIIIDKHKHFYFKDGILFGQCSNIDIIKHYLLSLHSNSSFDVKEAIITVGHDYEAFCLASFLTDNNFPLDYTVFQLNYSDK